MRECRYSGAVWKEDHTVERMRFFYRDAKPKLGKKSLLRQFAGRDGSVHLLACYTHGRWYTIPLNDLLEDCRFKAAIDD